MGMQEVSIKMNLDAQSVVSSAQNISDAFAHITEKMKEAQEAGNMDLVSKYANQAKNLQGLYNGMATGNTNKEKSSTGSIIDQSVATTKGIGNTVDNVTNQLGRSGNVFGAALSGAKSGLDIVGSLGDKAAKVAGFMGLGLLPGMLVNTLSGFYEQQMKPAMEINGQLLNTEQIWDSEEAFKANPQRFTNEDTGKVDIREIKDKDNNIIKQYLETATYRQKINTDNINTAFEQASKSAIKLGYSMEEGMEVVRQATQHGYTAGNIFNAEESILKWNSATGVDKGLLSDYKGRQYRFSNDKDGNSLAQAFATNSEMGMQRGQFSETLEALKSIFEEGISKGFVKGTAEIGATLATLYKASGESRFFQGSEGANRYMQMSNAIAGATALNSVTDILTYRATATGVSDEAKQQALRNASIKGSYGYIDNMIFMEQGVTPELLAEQRKAVEKVAGKDNKQEQIELYKNMYKLNYTGATQVYEMLQNLNPENKEEISKKIKDMQSEPKYLSDQKALLSTNEKIRYDVANLGKTASEIKYKMSNMVLALGGVATGKFGLGKAFEIMGRGKDEKAYELMSVSELQNEQERIKAKKHEMSLQHQELLGKGQEIEKERAQNGTQSNPTNEYYENANKIQEKINKLSTQYEHIEDELYNRKQNKEKVEDYANNGEYNEQKNLIRDAIKEALESADISITQR